MVDVTFRKATAADVAFVGARLREADRAEMLALGMEPERALRLSAAGSDRCWCGMIEGVPAMIFGWGQSLTADRGVIWGLGTDLLTRHPREMLVYGRAIVRGFLEECPRLGNWCDARYKAALRWLRKLGFTVEEPKPYGPRGADFCQFEMAKEE